MSSVFGTERVAYPGLRAFGREEFDLFFGRESCVDEMVDTLGRTCFLAVLGTSGSGKSSLVRTGLLNALELGFLATAGSTWRIAELRPRGHPIRSLAIALLGLQGIEKPDEAEIEILSAFLRRGPRSLVEWANGGHLPPRANLMVLVDQFEELFRYEDYSGREEAEAFVGLLVNAARENAPIYIAITMRSEYLGACTLIEGLPEVINRGLYLTPRMSRDECRQAIVGPAEVCGFRIEDRLVNKLLNDLTDFAPWEAGGGHDQQRRLGRRADQLPLMQHVLNLLWQRARVRNETDIVLTLEDYEAAGGLGGALDRHADEIAATVPPEYAEAIDPVFRSLVTGRTVADAVRRPTRFGDLVELAGGRRDAVLAVVDAFRAPGVNFFTPGHPDPIGDDSFIDISHESLIRQWRRLSRCLDEEAHSADAWHQLLSRSERYKAGAGGLLTGLDLDNLVDWWERTKPTAAWANRYGDNFEEAGQYLRDSQFAEADHKRREEEESRKLIAAEEAASSGRRFKRLAVALAAALIVAFAATGAAIYLWREANADALAADVARAEAEEARVDAEAARAEAEVARAEAEEQRNIAEAEAAEAEAARAEADRQRIIAEAEAEAAEVARQEADEQRALADASRQEAEHARAEAEAARQQADQIIDTSIAYFAKSLGDEVATIHSDPSLAPDLSYAGGLLSRLATDAQAEDASDIDVGFMDALRPTFVVQDVLTSAYVPAMGAGASDVTWADPPGGPGLVAVMDLAGKKLRITDRTGRIVALYEIPASFWGALADTPFAAVRGPDGAPIALLADTAGDVWIGSGGLGALQAVGNDANDFGRIDDVSFDRASGKIAIAYSVETVTGERRGDGGDAGRGSRLKVAVIENNVGGWRIAGSSWLPSGPLGAESGPVRLAGALGDLIFAVAEGAVVTVLAGNASAIDLPVPVVDAGMTEDGRLLLAGALRDANGQCFDAGGKQGFLDPWLGRDPESPVDAGLVVGETDATGTGETRAAANLPVAECLMLIDVGSGDPLWQGTTRAAKFDSVRGISGLEAIEFVEGTTANDLRVRRIVQAPEGWIDSAVDFDPDDWGLTGFSDTYASVAATGGAFPLALTPDLVDRRIKAGVLRRIASPPPGGRIVASRVAGDEVQIARIPAGADPSGGETALEVLVYRPEDGRYVKDDRIDTGGVACFASGQDGSCRFDAAAFSPNGAWLLLVSGGSHAFVDRSGLLGDWKTTTPEGAGSKVQVDRRATRARETGDGTETPPDGDTGPVEKAQGVGTEGDPGDAGSVTGVGGSVGPGLLLASVLPLDVEGRAFVGRSGPDGELWRLVQQGATAGVNLTSVTPIDLPTQVAAGITGFATDPERSTIYIWGPRIGLRMISGGSGGMSEAAFEFDSPLADVAPLPSGGVVAATTDGDVMVIPPDRFRLSGSRSTGVVAEPPVSFATGLGRFGAIDVWASSGRVVVSAGTPTANAGDGALAAMPAPADETDRAKLRAVGFTLDGDGRPQLAFITPWERIDGQLANGEAISASTGEILGEPPPLPDDEKLLSLTVMREEQHTEETPEFEIGFDMLHMRVAGDAGDAVRVSSCEWILTTAVRMGGDLQENIGEDVRRACDEPAATAPVVNAIFDDRNDQRTSVLLRYAPANPLALAVLISNLRQVVPAAAEVLASSYRSAQYDQWEAVLAAIAEGGPLPLATAGAEAEVFDPFAHWVLAMEGERTGGNAETLAESLFHYAYAERLFQTARFRTPEQIVKRRIALARSLSDDVVYEVFLRLQASPVNPDDAGSGQPMEAVPLDDVRQWLVDIGGSDPEVAKQLDVLLAPVEELIGDDLASTDRAAAAAHYWKAISLVASAGESLSQRPGVLGRIDKVQELGEKLAAVGSPMALADTSGAILGIIDAALTQPVRRDIDPPELRPAIESAFSDLATAGGEGYDLSRFRDLGLRFLDFDWESRFQSINQVGAERFYREVAAAEAFLTATLATASEEDRLHWLALRGRMRFWLSTLDGENLPYDGAVFRDWLSGALADYDAAGGPEKVGLWDATIIGGANSRMIELVNTESDVANYVEKASAAFRNAIDRHGDPNGVIGRDGKSEDFLDLDQYRRRLAYDGYVLALERAIIWLRADRFLSGVEEQPGDPDYDRGRLADIGYAALNYARQREALRAEAEVNGLIEKNSTWSLDTFGDLYWGSTVAQMGALLRIEDGANGSPNLCDRLAAHPYDVTRPTAAVDYDTLDVDAVLKACDDGAARSLYHQARALSKAATAPPDEILRLLLPSAREQLPIAYNNISLLMSDAGGTAEEVQELVSTFSQLSLITAYPEIAVLLREEQKSAERAETFEWLARKAAALGVPEAYLDIAELTPDVLTRARNYTIARNLYTEVGRTAEAEAMQAKLDAFNLSSTNISSLAAQAENWTKVTPRLLDDALITRIEDLLWDARSQASLR